MSGILAVTNCLSCVRSVNQGIGKKNEEVRALSGETRVLQVFSFSA